MSYWVGTQRFSTRQSKSQKCSGGSFFMIEPLGTSQFNDVFLNIRPTSSVKMEETDDRISIKSLWAKRYAERYSFESVWPNTTLEKSGTLPSEEAGNAQPIIALQMDLVDAFLDALRFSMASSFDAIYSSSAAPVSSQASLSDLSRYVDHFTPSDKTVPIRTNAVTKRKHTKARKPPFFPTCAPPLHHLPLPSLDTKKGVDYHVIVVGGGVSGLLATKILRDLCMKVLLLESRNYAGGRVRTETLPNNENILIEEDPVSKNLRRKKRAKIHDTRCLSRTLPAANIDLGANWLMYDVSYPQYVWHWAHQEKIQSSNILGSRWEPVCTALWFDECGHQIDPGHIQMLYDITIVAMGILNQWIDENESKDNNQKKEFNCFEDGIIAAIKWVAENSDALKIPLSGKYFNDTDMKVMMKMTRRTYGYVNNLSEIDADVGDGFKGVMKWYASSSYFQR
ncbi:hypothetical protein IE077_003024 [Cardiosporidium cionae]|uniref:Amine oxidase domain-containing protein n=1 Tax=Cardiosporidium cionae TaxID=476202 RepID=A0ABQ7J9B6_9APIC|nr:hypothetical protein IE077_003024 [Cardiosporidium cionae]|eukprot:KAF8820577.1 hypothetical protein IE077_003024 [Cardiosporidium cionae]